MRAWCCLVVLLAGVAEAQPKPAKIVQVGMYWTKVCALRDDGRVRCWGMSPMSFGGPKIGPSSAVPVDIPGIDKATAIQLDNKGVLALTADGHVQRAWLGNLSSVSKADQLFGLDNVVELAYGFRAAARLRDGTVVALDSTVRPSTLTNIVALRGSFAIDRDGVAWNIGGSTDVTIQQTSISDAVGFTGLAIRRKGGELASWSLRSGKIDIAAPPNNTVDRVEADGTTCVIADGTVRCKGDNRFGQLGVDGPSRKDFVDVKLPARATQLAGDRGTFCAVLADGGLACWGANLGGQLGDGTLRDRSTPQLVAGATAAQPPAYTTGFDQPQEGPAFDWKALPAGCRKPADMIDTSGAIDLKTVVSAYAYRSKTDTNLLFADFLLDPRSRAPNGDVRGNQRTMSIQLGGTSAGRYSIHAEKRSASITSHRYNDFVMTMVDSTDDVVVQLSRYDNTWLCGTLTVRYHGKTVTRPLAARVSKVE